MPRKRNPVLVVADAMQGMNALVGELNRREGKEWAVSALELRKIVKQWQDSGPNLSKLWFSDLVLAQDMRKAFQPSLVPTKSGSAKLLLINPICSRENFDNLIDCLEGSPREPHDRFFALAWFIALIVNPLWKNLGGPCARCKNYFVKKKIGRDKYCGSRCGSVVSADKANREKLNRERTEKLDRAKTLIQEWDALKRPPNMIWKQWVHDRDKTITPKWLTRATNPDSGIGYGLQPPMKEGRNAKG